MAGVQGRGGRKMESTVFEQQFKKNFKKEKRKRKVRLDGGDGCTAA